MPAFPHRFLLNIFSDYRVRWFYIHKDTVSKTPQNFNFLRGRKPRKLQRHFKRAAHYHTPPCLLRAFSYLPGVGVRTAKLFSHLLFDPFHTSPLLYLLRFSPFSTVVPPLRRHLQWDGFWSASEWEVKIFKICFFFPSVSLLILILHINTSCCVNLLQKKEWLIVNACGVTRDLAVMQGNISCEGCLKQSSIVLWLCLVKQSDTCVHKYRARSFTPSPSYLNNITLCYSIHNPWSFSHFVMSQLQTSVYFIKNLCDRATESGS